MNQKWKSFIVATFLLTIVYLCISAKNIFAWSFDASAPRVTITSNCATDPCTVFPTAGTPLRFTVNIDESLPYERGIAFINVTRTVVAGNPARSVICQPAGSPNADRYDFPYVELPATPQRSYQIICTVDSALPSEVKSLTVLVQDYAGNQTTASNQINMQPIYTWVQVNNASFHKRSAAAFTNPVAATATPPEFAIGEEGVVSSSSVAPINMAPGTISSSRWQITRFTTAPVMTASTFLSYVRARKDVQTFSPALTSSLLSNTTYSVGASDPVAGLLIDTNTKEGYIAQSRTVIIVNGNVTFSTATPNRDFNAAGNSVAILATGTIRVHSNYRSINAVLIASNIDYAYDRAATDPQVTRQLTINGNLITTSAAANTTLDKRTSGVINTPTLAVNFNPKMYMELLPDLSTVLYEWRQVNE